MGNTITRILINTGVDIIGMVETLAISVPGIRVIIATTVIKERKEAFFRIHSE